MLWRKRLVLNLCALCEYCLKFHMYCRWILGYRCTTVFFLLFIFLASSFSRVNYSAVVVLCAIFWEIVASILQSYWKCWQIHHISCHGLFKLFPLVRFSNLLQLILYHRVGKPKRKTKHRLSLKKSFTSHLTEHVHKHT